MFPSVSAGPREQPPRFLFKVIVLSLRRSIKLLDASPAGDLLAAGTLR
jgi:hypothetical protein